MAGHDWAPQSPDLSAYAPQSPDLSAYNPHSPALQNHSTWAPQSPGLSAAPNFGLLAQPNVPDYGLDSGQYFYPPQGFQADFANPPSQHYQGQIQGQGQYQQQPLFSDQQYPAYPDMPQTRAQKMENPAEQDSEWAPQEVAAAAPPLRQPAQRTRKPKGEAAVKREKMDTGGIEVRTKFPTARIKRIMQADEDVGKVAQVTPVVMAKALELFMIRLISASAGVAKSRGSKRVLMPHMKAAVMQDEQFDNLREIVGRVPDAPTKGGGGGGADDDDDDTGDAAGSGKKRKKSAAAGAKGKKRRSSDDDF